MTNEQLKKLNELERKMEENIVQSENSLALAESMHDTFDDVMSYVNSDKDKSLALYEIDRVSKRTEVFFNMLRSLLQEATEKNNELVTELSKIRQSVGQDSKLKSEEK